MIEIFYNPLNLGVQIAVVGTQTVTSNIFIGSAAIFKGVNVEDYNYKDIDLLVRRNHECLF
jgi:hypothetical protein